MVTQFIQRAGASILSRSVDSGATPLKWALREESQNPADNGWRFFGADDDDAYLADPGNLLVVDFNRVVELEPAVLPIWDLPVGSDLQIVSDATGVRVLDNRTGAVVVGTA